MRRFHKPGARQLLDLRLRQRRFRPIDAGEIPMHREARRLELIAQAAHLPIGQFGLDQPIELGLGLHRPLESFARCFTAMDAVTTGRGRLKKDILLCPNCYVRNGRGTKLIWPLSTRQSG